MNKPNNKRKKESVARIENALFELLQDRPLNRVSVAALCKRANLNRSTFYANYADIYALADSIRDKLQKSLSELYQCQTIQNSNRHDYRKLFEHIYENQTSYRLYFQLGYANQDSLRNHPYDTALAEQLFQNRFIDYHREFFFGGLNRLIQYWLENGCRETPDELVEILQSEYRVR